jgi:hypothetical protein
MITRLIIMWNSSRYNWQESLLNPNHIQSIGKKRKDMSCQTLNLMEAIQIIQGQVLGTHPPGQTD